MDRAKRKFRSFLLASLNHFLANEWDRANAIKRGSQYSFISLDDKSAEDRYQLEPATNLFPEKVFEWQWALTLLENVFSRLREEFSAAGKTKQFELLKNFLEGETASGDYTAVSAELGVTPNAVAAAVRRARRRYRELVREEIAQTVSGRQKSTRKCSTWPKLSEASAAV